MALKVSKNFQTLTTHSRGESQTTGLNQCTRVIIILLGRVTSLRVPDQPLVVIETVTYIHKQFILFILKFFGVKNYTTIKLGQ